MKNSPCSIEVLIFENLLRCEKNDEFTIFPSQGFIYFLYNNVVITSYYINTSAVKSSSVCTCNFILILQLFSIFGEKIEHYFEFDYPTQRQRSHNSFLLYVLMLSLFCLGNKLL